MDLIQIEREEKIKPTEPFWGTEGWRAIESDS